MLEAINNAKHSVFLCTYIFASDETGKAFVSALAACVVRGVQVRVLIDSNGSLYSFPSAIRLLRKAGVPTKRFLPLFHRDSWLLNMRNHRKIVAVDGQLAFTGGMNIGSRHMVGRFRDKSAADIQFLIEGTAARSLTDIFCRDWHFATGELLEIRDPFKIDCGRTPCRPVSDGPDSEIGTLPKLLLGLIGIAKENITIVTPYFLPPPAITGALIGASLRGVRVRILLPEHSNLPYMTWATEHALGELLGAAIEVYYQPKPFSHTKMLLIDSDFLQIGSYNMDKYPTVTGANLMFKKSEKRAATVVFALMIGICFATISSADEQRPRARDIGLIVGIFEPGPLNAITDVAGVKVGHATVIEGDDIRTGVTAIIPAPGNLYTHPIPAWIHVGNGYGKLIGETQVREFGEIETPILLTCTLCVWSAANALKDWTYEQPGMGEHTVNPIIGETNDSYLNDMWADPVQREAVFAALDSASDGPVTEGSVGAGTGTRAFGWKGGIGTSSRVLPEPLGGYTVGVLVQTNFGDTLSMNGAPVGRELGIFTYSGELEAAKTDGDKEDGSIMIVVATNAPLDARTLDRLAMRAIMGLARTGSYASNGSGDYVIAFSTHPSVRRPRTSDTPIKTEVLVNASMSPLFAATSEATEEAIYNAILKATTVSSSRGERQAIPIADVKRILEKYEALNWDKTLPP